MKTSIIIQNLKCGGCAKTITSKISAIENISNVEVDVEESKVSFEYTNTSNVIDVKNKLLKLGYPSIDDKNNLTTKANSFVSCATGKLRN